MATTSLPSAGTQKTRRHRRALYTGPFRITWQDQRQEVRYAQGKCIDVSEGGMKIEVPCPIAVGTRLTMQIERLGYWGTASVRHAVRYGARYILGLETSQGLPSGKVPAQEPLA
jgi:hypothetical protein